MIIRDNLGLPLNLSTRGLSEPKSKGSTAARLPLPELRRELKNPTGIVRIEFSGMTLGVYFRPPAKKTSFVPPFRYETGRIGCRTIPAAEWKKMVAFVKTTKNARAAKAGA